MNKEWDVLRSSHINFNAEIIQFINFLIQFADVIILSKCDHIRMRIDLCGCVKRIATPASMLPFRLQIRK